MYEIRPTSGRTWRCNGAHILSLRQNPTKHPHGATRPPAAPQFITVEDWLKLDPSAKAAWSLWRTAVDFAPKAPPDVDPYLLGVSLAAQTSPTRNQAARLEPPVSTPSPNQEPDPAEDPGRTAKSKTIPHALRTGSQATRFEIIAGLLDAAGAYDHQATRYRLALPDPTLLADAAFIAGSLGLTATLVREPANPQLPAAEPWRDYLAITGDLGSIPVRLQKNPAAPHPTSRGITPITFEVRPIGEGAWFGIVLDGDHQFLLDDFTVTHNTAGLVVPSIISCDNISWIINDIKPEIYQMTGAHRATVSHVIMIDWSKMDKHELKIDADTGAPILDKNGKPQFFHTLYPRINFLSPTMVPAPGPDRDTYVSTVANALIPRRDAGKGDEYFADKGRDALTGMIHMILARVNDREPDDPKRYQGMPGKWHGKEASLGMLADWIAYSQFAATDEKPESDKAANGQEQDRIGVWIRRLCEEINPETRIDGNLKGTTARGFGSLSQLIAMADRERSGVLGTMDQALLPFKNESVQQRTESSDFTPDDLRGIRDPDGTWKPVTLYICVNQAEADAFSTITGLLYEVLNRSLLSYAPESYNPRTRRQLGPFPVCFGLDEWSKLPRLQSILDGPAISRSMGVSYMLVAQSYGQIEQRYSKADVQTINNVTSVKFVLPQNEVETIRQVIAMVGKTTIRRSNLSFQEGVGTRATPFGWNRSDQAEETDFLRQEEVVAMPQGTHIALVQEFNNRPMRLDTPLFFKDPAMLAKVRSRKKGPIATEVLPRHVRRARIKAFLSNLADRDSTLKARFAAAQERSITVSRDIENLP